MGDPKRRNCRYGIVDLLSNNRCMLNTEGVDKAVCSNPRFYLTPESGDAFWLENDLQYQLVDIKDSSK